MVLELPTNTQRCKETKQRNWFFNIIYVYKITFWVGALRHNIWLWGLCFSYLVTVSWGCWESSLKFSKYMQLFPVLITLFQFYSIQLCSAECIFLHGLWLKTLESSWILGISQKILDHYTSYSWSGDLGFLRLMKLFPWSLFSSSHSAVNAYLTVVLLCPGCIHRHTAGSPGGSSRAFPAHSDSCAAGIRSQCLLSSLLWQIRESISILPL